MQETQETWVRSPGQEDPLEKEIATHSSGKIAWTEESGVATTEWLSMLPCTHEGSQAGFSEGDRNSCPGCVNSKFKSLMGLCLVFPETAGDWSGLRKGWIPRGEVRKAKGQVTRGHLDY